jgi:hypothetical protein
MNDGLAKKVRDLAVGAATLAQTALNLLSDG